MQIKRSSKTNHQDFVATQQRIPRLIHSSMGVVTGGLRGYGHQYFEIIGFSNFIGKFFNSAPFSTVATTPLHSSISTQFLVVDKLLHSSFSGNFGKSAELDNPQEGMQCNIKIPGGHLQRNSFIKAMQVSEKHLYFCLENWHNMKITTHEKHLNFLTIWS